MCDYSERHVTVVSMQASFHVFHALPVPTAVEVNTKGRPSTFYPAKGSHGGSTYRAHDNIFCKFYREAWIPTYLYKGHSQVLDQA